MRRPNPLPLSEPVFAVREALERGVPVDRLRRADLVAPLRGLRARTGDTPELESVCRAYLSAGHGTRTFSHRTAARLHGLPGFGPPGDLDVATTGRAPRAAGVHGRQLDLRPGDVVTLRGIRVTSVARTWADLAESLTDERLLAVGDRALWHRDPLTTRSELEAITLRMAGRRGARRRAAVLPLLSERADSAPESILRWRIRAAGLPDPVVNEDVRSNGRFIGRPDLAFPEFRLALEYEGDHHRTDREQWHRDLARTPRFEDAGWRVIRAAAPDLRDSSRLLRVLTTRLRAP